MLFICAMRWKAGYRDAEAQRIINNADEHRTLDNYTEERDTNDKNAERRHALAND